METRSPLTNDQIRSKAPAIFATKPSSKVSDKYVMVPMNEVIDDLRQLGWFPYDVRQARSKNTANANTQTHMVKFRQEKDFKPFKNVGDEIFELLSINSHNGRVPLSFFSGVFKLACENGLVIMQQEFGNFRVKHIGFTFPEMEELIINHVKKSQDAAKFISEFKKVELKDKEKIELASTIHKELKLKSPLDLLLSPRRAEDDKGDLWTVFNVIQENITKGGLYYLTGPKNRKVKTRPIKNIQRDIDANLTMWGILNQFYETRF
jgi:hypothetical protein